MSNSFQIPSEIEAEIRKRDHHCIYCGKLLKSKVELKAIGNGYKDERTLEHLYYKEPFYWKGKPGKPGGLTKIGIAYCCRSCNSSRGAKPLKEWFTNDFCVINKINEQTVAAPVKEFIEIRKKIGSIY